MPTCYKVNIYKIEKNNNDYEEKIQRKDLIRNYLLFAKSYEDDFKYPILNDINSEKKERFIEENEAEMLYDINNDIYSTYSNNYFENVDCKGMIIVSSSDESYQLLPKNLIGKEYIKKSELTKANQYFAETIFDDLLYDEEKPMVLIKK